MSRLRGLATGEQIGRWRVVAPARDVGELLRVRVADDAGTPAEALLLGPEASDDARRRFAARHRKLLSLDPPALADVLDVVESADRVFVVRAPTESATLADAEVPIGGAQVAAIGVRLHQAVTEAAPALGGALLPHDVALDDQGHPLLAPTGQSPTTLPRDWLGHVAPEAFRAGDDEPSGHHAALYGLGALLYRLATGSSPAGAASPDRPPPVPASHLRHGLHPSLDQAIQLLLSPEPTEREAALPLLQEVAGELDDLRPRTGAGRVGEVRYTTQATARVAARADDDPGALVILPSSEWSRLTAAQRSHAAGLAGVALSAADDLARQGLPVVLATAVGRAGGRRRAEELRTDGELPVHAVTGGGVPGSVPLVTGLLVAAVPAILGALSLLPGWWWLGIPLLALGGMIAALAVVIGAAIGRTRSHQQQAMEAWRQQRHHQRVRGGRGRLDPAWDRAARLRLQLARQDHLPEAAEADLRDALRDLEAQLLATAEQAASAGKALEQVDSDGLRTRVEALSLRSADDPAAREERDRLARTVADLDAVEAQQRALLATVRDIDGQLDGIAAAVGRAAADDAGLDRLAQTAVDRREAERRARAAQRQREGP